MFPTPYENLSGNDALRLDLSTPSGATASDACRLGPLGRYGTEPAFIGRRRSQTR